MLILGHNPLYLLRTLSLLLHIEYKIDNINLTKIMNNDKILDVILAGELAVPCIHNPLWLCKLKYGK